MLAVIKKELKNYFFTPVGYIVIGIFLTCFSAIFFLTTIQTPSVDLTNLFYGTAIYGLMFMVPILTMWTISGERRSGTDQILMTSPVGMFGAVIAKFLSAFILIFVPVICTLIYFAIISYYQIPNIPTYLTSALGFLLLSMTYISFGILASSITESPIISGILTFSMVFLTTWIPSWFSSLQNFSLLDKFIKYLYGEIDIANTVLFITLTMLALAITMIIMQRRKSIK